MARQNPIDRGRKRMSVDEVLSHVGDTINYGLGNLVGGAIEKVKLGGREATGTHKFSETYQGRRRKKMAGIKGIAARTDIY